MKKISTLILVLFALLLLPVNSLAYELPVQVPDGLLISPAPDRELLVSLKNGVIPKTHVEDLDDLFSYFDIIDDSEEKFLSRKLVHLFEFIPEYYYGEVTKADLLTGLLESDADLDIHNMNPVYNALFGVLDKFSYHLSPEEAERFFSPTANRGIGIKMMWKEVGDKAGIYVTDVADGSPAKTAGIKSGDRLIAFNGVDVSGLGFQSLSALLQSVPDEQTALSVKLEREGVVSEYALERTLTVFDEYEFEIFEEKNLIYLTINSFMYSSTATKISVALDSLYEKGYRDIIVDLTSNSGGDVFVASEILSKFISKKDVPLFYLGRDGTAYSIPFMSRGDGHDFNSVKILVGENTASSAEIFAYSLRETIGAEILGTLTYGKGVAQVTAQFLDGSACGITTYVAYNAKGETYNTIGVTPDETVVGVFKRNSLDEGTPNLTYHNFKGAYFGAQNKRVLGLEKRLETLGFLSPSSVDEIWDENTTLALKCLQKVYGLSESGQLDENTYFSLMNLIKAYEKTVSQTFTLRDYTLRKYGIFE